MKFRFVATLLTAALLWTRALAAGPADSPVRPVPADRLETAISESIDRVDAFRFLKEEAARLGVRVYLSGGTASSFAIHVRDHLDDAGKEGQAPLWDLPAIYRTTQDMDLIVDGPADAAARLHRTMESRFPLYRGERSAWDFGLLREDWGKHIALLGNRDFTAQNNDSHSTGLIELTSPPAGGRRITDLHETPGKDPAFLTDIRNGEITFYRSASHGGTKFAREGRNPEIVSAMRYLYKAFLSGARMKEEDLAEVRRIIRDFRPASVTDPYVRARIEDIGSKMLTSARNLEAAVATLDELGLRSKLVELGEPDKVGSMSWLMNRKPLPSREIRRSAGWGRTARQLFDELGHKDLTIAHETRDLRVYDSIVRSDDGHPNFFVSRSGLPGEAARHGEGVYALPGTQGRGSGGTGLTIRMELDPDAPLGQDFDYKEGEIILKNRKAVRVIPQMLGDSISVEEIIAKRRLPQLAGSDRGMNERIIERILPRLIPAIRKEIGKLLDSDNRRAAKEVADLLHLLPREDLYDDLLEAKHLPKLARLMGREPYRSLEELYYRNSDRLYRDLPAAARTRLAKGMAAVVAEEAASVQPDGRRLQVIVWPMVNANRTAEIAVPLQAMATRMAALPRESQEWSPLAAWFNLPESREHPEIVRKLAAGKIDGDRAWFLLNTIYHDNELVRMLPPRTRAAVVESSMEVLSRMHSGHRNHESKEALKLLVETDDFRAGTEVFAETMRRELQREHHSHFLGDLIEFGLPRLKNPDAPAIWELLSAMPEKMEFLLSRIGRAIAEPPLAGSPAATAFVDQMMQFHARDTSNHGWAQEHLTDLMEPVLKGEGWAKSPKVTEWFNELMTVSSPIRGDRIDRILHEALAGPALADHPLHDAWVEKMKMSRYLRSPVRPPGDTRLSGSAAARKTTSGTSTGTSGSGSSGCADLFSAFWDPFGLLKAR